MTGVSVQLMFQGQMRDALALWQGIFHELEVEELGPDLVQVTFGGQTVRLFDSPPVHDFAFTPSFSFFVTVDEEAEVDRLASLLSGTALMPPGAYDFARRFAWVTDPFGVSWQISFP
ncbi:MAG: VOC family protein [Pseudomonadota bacterium]